MLPTTTSQDMNWLSPLHQQENFFRSMVRDEGNPPVAPQASDPLIDVEAIIDQGQTQTQTPKLVGTREIVRQVEHLAGRYEAAERARHTLEAKNIELMRRLAHSERALRQAVSQIEDLQSQLCLSQKTTTIAQNNCAIATALLRNNNSLHISLAAPEIRIRRADRSLPSLPMPTEIDRFLSGLGDGYSSTQHLSMPDATQHDNSKRTRHCPF